MKPSDELYFLVNSMTAKEKHFFRKKYLSLTEDEGGNYLKMFDEISRQVSSGNDYDERKIKSGNYTGKFIKNLSFHKNFLYNSILNSLAIFNKESKDVYSLKNMITQAEILADKLLYEQSMKLLRKAERIAREKDMFVNLYEIFNIERTIGKYSLSAEEYVSSSKKLFEEQYELIDLLKNLLDFYKINEDAGLFLRKFGAGKIRDKTYMKEFEDLFNNSLLKDLQSAKSFLPRYIFFNMKLQYFLTIENYGEAYRNAKSAVELCENNFSKLKGKLDNYVYSLNNLLNCEIRNKKYDEFDMTSEKLKNIPLKYSDQITESNKVFIFYSLSVMRLSKNMEMINTEKLVELETEIRDELPLFENKITLYQRIILYYFLCSSNFFQGKFENCIYWNSKIFNLGKTDLSEDYQCYARIIQLISYYELGYIDSMEYALKSAYHFISKKKKIYAYENIIQKYLRKSFRVKTNSELMVMFDEMKNEIQNLLKDPFEKNALDAFNILYWLESKLENTSVREVVSKKSS